MITGTVTGWAADRLRGVADQADDDIDLGEAALALAALDRSGVDLDAYRGHLRELAAAVQDCVEDDPSVEQRREALNQTILGKHGYAGDTQTYDDLQNANLMSVIDRRRGLPVTLGILYLTTARSLGWAACGINFPGHFLIRMDSGGERLIMDPFHEGRSRDAADLRDLLKLGGGLDAELEPEHYEPASSREVLIRLQNNIKARLVHMADFAGAQRSVETMLLFAPEHPPLLRDLGVLCARQGHLIDAIETLERYVTVVEADDARQEAARLIQQLRAQLT